MGSKINLRGHNLGSTLVYQWLRVSANRDTATEQYLDGRSSIGCWK
jgi:hypothetical protein